MSNDLTQQIADAAVTPQSMASDGNQIASRSLSELIEADRYLAAKNASRNPTKSLNIVQIVPPGKVQ
jgi:hypothetical protein